MQISQDSALLFCWQFTMWRPHLLAAEQRTRCQLYPSSWALVTCHNIVLHKPQHSSLTAKRADQYGYKQLAIGSLMFDALTLFARTCLKLMAAQGKPWAVLFPCCRQISELDIMCKNCSMVEDFKPHITFGNNIQTKRHFDPPLVSQSPTSPLAVCNFPSAFLSLSQLLSLSPLSLP